MKFIGKVYVMPRADLLDPQGNAVRSALHNLGFRTVEDVRVGKEIDVTFEAEDGNTALERLKEMCEKLLVNPITEQYEMILLAEGTQAPAKHENVSDIGD